MTRLAASVLSTLFLTLLSACDAGIDAGGEPLARDEPPVQARRCPHCGWIESKREIPAGYEYTVRMSDGSSSVFQQALPASWRLRERLTVN